MPSAAAPVCLKVNDQTHSVDNHNAHYARRPLFGCRTGSSGARTSGHWGAAARRLLDKIPEEGTGVVGAAYLADLVKAFERIRHDHLVAEAIALDYPMAMLRLSIVCMLIVGMAHLCPPFSM